MLYQLFNAVLHYVIQYNQVDIIVNKMVDLEYYHLIILYDIFLFHIVCGSGLRMYTRHIGPGLHVIT